jgi:hypothetical protein
MKNTKHNDEAVSPVIGVILMVAIDNPRKSVVGLNRNLGGRDRSLRIRLSGWNAEH